MTTARSIAGRLSAVFAGTLLLLTALLVFGCASSPRSESASLEGLSVEIIQSNLTAGLNQTAFVLLRTSPNALCFIAVEYAGGFSEASDVIPKRADSDGIVRWEWKISPSTTLGTWPVTIICSLGSDSIATQLELVVLDLSSESDGET